MCEFSGCTAGRGGKRRKVTLAVPPPPRRITSGIEVIWFVGHLGGGRVLGPYRPLGAWARALVHPPPPPTFLTPVPSSPLSASHPQLSLPLLPVPSSLPPPPLHPCLLFTFLNGEESRLGGQPVPLEIPSPSLPSNSCHLQLARFHYQF